MQPLSDFPKIVVSESREKIRSLLSNGETETIEFKKSFNDETLEAIGAFANAQGGLVLIGISDSGQITGFQLGKKTIEDIANQIQQAMDPRIQPSITTVSHDGKDIVVIRVKKSSSAPISVRGRFFKRSGKSNQRMSHEEIIHAITINAAPSWDTQLETTASVEDLDQSLIERFIESANKLGRRPVPKHISTNELLQKLKLIKGNTPTRAALLIFGKTPEDFFPSAFLKIGRFRTPTLICDDREVHGPLIQQLDDAMTWFRGRLTTEFIINGKPEREVNWEYPLDAIREAIVNVLCHRDFTHDAHSQIRLYDDRLELWNPGSLPTSLTPEDLFHEHDSVPRNRKIAEIFFYMGFIERWGSGTLRIVNELKQANFPKPTFLSEMGKFKLIIHKLKTFPKEKLMQMELSERQIKAIDFVVKQGSITNSEYQKLTGISKRTATRDFEYLISKGILINDKNQRGPGTSYRINDS